MEVLLKMTNLCTNEVGYTRRPTLAVSYAEIAMRHGTIAGYDPYRIELVRMSAEEVAKIPDDQWGRP